MVLVLIESGPKDRHMEAFAVTKGNGVAWEQEDLAESEPNID